MKKYFYLFLCLFSSLFLTCNVKAFSYTVKEGSCSITEQGSVPARDVDMFITGSCNAGSILTFKLYENGTLCDSGDCTFVTSMVPINKSGFDNNFTPIAYDPFTGVGGRTTILNRFAYFTFAGDTWKYKEFLGGPHDKKSATAYFHNTEFLILNSTIALKFDSTSSFGVALHGDIITSKGVEIITNTYNSTMDNIDLDKMDEQLETSKSIWQTLKDILTGLPDWFSNLANSIGDFFANLISSMGQFFSDLKDGIGGFFENMLNGIKELFYGKEEKVCTTYTNLFNGFDYSGRSTSLSADVKRPNENGYIYNFTGYPTYYAKAIPDIKANTEYTIILEYENNSVGGLTVSTPSSGIGTQFPYLGVSSVNVTANTPYYFYMTTSNDVSQSYSLSVSLDGGTTGKPITGGVRFMILEGHIDKDTFEYEYFSSTKEDCEVTGSTTGLFGIINNLGTSIKNWLTELLQGILDGIKALFVPTDEQLYEIIDDSSKLTENFGFVGESVSFFITIFTSLLGLVNANGCVELPEFSIGETTLFPAHKFWDEQLVCLNDNQILSSNISTIRTITSIVLVCMFINFAASKFFTILSKNDFANDSSGTDTVYDGPNVTSTEWSRRGTNTTRTRKRYKQ